MFIIFAEIISEEQKDKVKNLPIYFVIIVLQTLIIGKDLPGYPSLMCAILFMGGIQLLCLGIVGEYLAKTFIETKNRPIYIEKERINLDDKEN